MAKKILIVDDDIDTLKLVGMMLEQKGYEILATSNGKKALEIADAKLPDLILLDVMMPEMDGYEVSRRLRANPETEPIPIIMFTAKSQVDDKIEGLEAGADAYLTKPTQPRELFAQVKAILKRAPKRAAVVQAPVVAPPTGKVFGVLAAKGGIGVSTLALNLAVSLHDKTEESTILSDYRPGQGTLSLDLGLRNPSGMLKLLENNKVISQKDVKGNLLPHASGIKTLLASHEPEDAKYTEEADKFLAITKHLRYLASYIILDLGSSFSPLISTVIDQCDRVILCMEPTPNNVQQTRLLFDALVKAGVGMGLITNVLINRMRTSVQLNLEQVEDIFGHPVSTVFTPVPEMAYQAARANIPLIHQSPSSLTSRQFEKLASVLA